jgi:hypothetical protein
MGLKAAAPVPFWSCHRRAYLGDPKTSLFTTPIPVTSAAARTIGAIAMATSLRAAG